MFKKTDEKKGAPSPRERAGGASRLTPGESAISIIGPGMRIQGDISTDGTVRVEGRVDGTIRAGKAVVLGKEGEIHGNVFTQDAVIGGRVTGTIVAESRLELQSTSVIDGEIRARAEHLQLDEGARFNGQIQMNEDGEPPRAAATPAKRVAAPETLSETARLIGPPVSRAETHRPSQPAVPQAETPRPTQPPVSERETPRGAPGYRG